MKMNRLNLGFIFIALSILFITINSEGALAAGIMGDVKDFVFFSPGLTKTYTYTVISNTDKVMDHEIELMGDLAPYFTVSKHVLKDLAPGGADSFTSTMTLPQELEPGEHRGYVCALETQTRGAGGTGGASIGTRVRICALVVVFSAYPGKFIDFELLVGDANKGEKIPIVLVVTNYGTDPVTVDGEIEILFNDVKAGEESRVVTLKTNSEYLKTAEQKTLTATLDTKDMNIGGYTAVATVYYDGNHTTKERDFRIGDVYIDILNFTDKALKNQLNTLNIYAKSNWNQKINEVYSNVIISDSEGRPVANLNSPPISMEPWENNTMQVFWDTTNLTGETYNIYVTVNYENKNTTKVGQIRLVEGAVKISMLTILLVALILVVILLIILIITLLKKMTEKGKGEKRVIKIKKR